MTLILSGCHIHLALCQAKFSKWIEDILVWHYLSIYLSIYLSHLVHFYSPIDLSILIDTHIIFWLCIWISTHMYIHVIGLMSNKWWLNTALTELFIWTEGDLDWLVKQKSLKAYYIINTTLHDLRAFNLHLSVICLFILSFHRTE